MSGSVNKVTLIGNLTADPEIRSTQSGQNVANLRLATNESWFNKQTGNKEERTEYHAVSCWGKQAELCAQYLKKGRKIYLEGRLQSREYQTQDGQTRKVWEVVANQVVFLGGRSDGPSEQSRPASKPDSGTGWGQPKKGPDNLGWNNAGQSSSMTDEPIPF